MKYLSGFNVTKRGFFFLTTFGEKSVRLRDDMSMKGRRQMWGFEQAALSVLMMEEGNYKGGIL